MQGTNPKFLMTKSQVSEVSKRTNLNDDEIGKLLDDIEIDIDTTNSPETRNHFKKPPYES